MEVSIVRRGVLLDESLRSFVHDKVDTTLGRLNHEIRSVRIQLEDTNGPRGGLDKRCVVTVSGDRFNPCVVETLDVGIHAAIAQALHIATRALIRSLQRERDLFGFGGRPGRSTRARSGGPAELRAPSARSVRSGTLGARGAGRRTEAEPAANGSTRPLG